MFIRIHAYLLIVVAALLTGCNVEPEYRSEHVVFDDDLVGTWEFEPDPSRSGESPRRSMWMQIKSRAVPISGGRLRPGGGLLAAGDSAPPNGYIVTLRESTASHQFGAFLIPIGDERILGYQYAGDALDRTALGVHTAHHFVRCRRDGDRLELTFPLHSIAFLPVAQPLDPVPAHERFPTLDELEARKKAVRDDRRELGSLFVVFDIDRLVEALQYYAPQPGFWSEHRMAARRVSGSAN